MSKENFKILALVGSRKGKLSNTARFCMMAVETFKAKYINHKIELELLTADLWNVGPCLSCNHCFQEGFCPQEQTDGAGRIKEKILHADCLILASPVYAGTVSGDMKILIDRLSCWLHTMPLIGKSAVLLSTADSNHGSGAITYMKEIVEKMGAVVLCGENVFVHFGPVLLGNEKDMASVLQKIADALKQGLDGKLIPTAGQEQYFKMQSHIYEKYRAFGKAYPCLRIAEESIWEQQGYFEVNSIKEMIEKNRTIQEL